MQENSGICRELFIFLSVIVTVVDLQRNYCIIDVMFTWKRGKNNKKVDKLDMKLIKKLEYVGKLMYLQRIIYFLKCSSNCSEFTALDHSYYFYPHSNHVKLNSHTHTHTHCCLASRVSFCVCIILFGHTTHSFTASNHICSFPSILYFFRPLILILPTLLPL